MQGSLDFCASRHSDQRPGILQGMAGLAKCKHRDRHAIFSFRMPLALGDLQIDCQNAVAELSRGSVILIGGDVRLCKSRTAKKGDAEENRWQAKIKTEFKASHGRKRVSTVQLTALRVKMRDGFPKQGSCQG